MTCGQNTYSSEGLTCALTPNPCNTVCPASSKLSGSLSNTDGCEQPKEPCSSSSGTAGLALVFSAPQLGASCSRPCAEGGYPEDTPRILHS